MKKLSAVLMAMAVAVSAFAGEYKEISVKEARALVDGKKATFIDVPGAVVLAADTVVAAGRRILPKAGTEVDARACLTLLSGRRHRVITAVILIGPGNRRVERLAESVVTFARLTPTQIDAYIKIGEWHGKAGGYALAKAPDLITFADVIRAIDGPLALTPCTSRTAYQRCEDCRDEATCALRKTLVRVRDASAQILESTTLAEAATQARLKPGPANEAPDSSSSAA